MFSKKPSKPQTQIDSLIGTNTAIGGDLNFSGGLRIDGQVNGNVTARTDKPSTLVLSEHGLVNGDVSVTHLVINGAINGSVTARDYLELQSKAKVTGDVHYKTMEIHLGAIVDGRLIHSGPESDVKAVVAAKPDSGDKSTQGE